MSFMERLHSSLILKTPLYHPLEAEVVEHPHQPFYTAIRTADHATLIQMIKNGFDVDYHELVQLSPLIYAITHHREEIVRTLLLYGANPNISDTDNNTALHYSVELHQNEIVHLLMRYGADKTVKNSKRISPLDRAMQLRDPKIFKTLSITVSMYTPCKKSLFEYAKEGDLIGLVHSLQSGKELFDTNADGQSLLHLGMLGNNIKLVIYLLNRQLNIDAMDKYGITPLMIASVHSRYQPILSLLIQRHATLDHKSNNGSTALSMALRNGNAPAALYLIEHGANIHMFDVLHTSLTLCHYAIEKFPANAVEFRNIQTLLLEKGAHVDISTNSLKWTPLFHTVSRHQDSSSSKHLNLLLRMGADVNYIDTNGRSALMLAASMGRLDAVEALLNNYAECNKLDKFGWSALMLGAYYNHYHICSFLLEFGCDVNLTSDNGLNVYKIAYQHNRTKIISLLIDFGVNLEEDKD